MKPRSNEGGRIWRPGSGHTTGIKPRSNEPDTSHVQTPLDGLLREGALPNGSRQDNQTGLDAEVDERGDDGPLQVHRSRGERRCLVGRHVAFRAATDRFFSAAISALHLHRLRGTASHGTHRPGRETEAKGEQEEQAEEHR